MIYIYRSFIGEILKFIYEYRTSDNKLHSAVINAASRELVFSTLKAQGINPSKVIEAPGLLNKLFGKGKRWIAIGVLALAFILSLFALLKKNVNTNQQLQKADELDPAIIQRFEDMGHDAEAIRELMQARKRLNEEYRSRVSSQVQNGTMTKKEANDLLTAIGLRPLE